MIILQVEIPSKLTKKFRLWPLVILLYTFNSIMGIL